MECSDDSRLKEGSKGSAAGQKVGEGDWLESEGQSLVVLVYHYRLVHSKLTITGVFCVISKERGGNRGFQVRKVG